MADYDLSKPAPDRTHRVLLDSGSGTGGIGFIIAGVVFLLVVLYAVFGGAGVSTSQDPSDIAAPAVDGAPDAGANAASNATPAPLQ